MKSYPHISLYDLLFLGTIFVGTTFTLLLGFLQSVNRAANRRLALALTANMLVMAGMLLRWERLPLSGLLATGLLVYFYVLKVVRPDYRFGWKDLLHFCTFLWGVFAAYTLPALALLPLLNYLF